MVKAKKLTQVDLEKFKVRLLEIKAELSESIVGNSNDVRSAEQKVGYSQHQADQGTDNFVLTVNLELSSKEQNVLRQVDRALEKIEEGTYGICDLSEEPIPIKRLEAIPYAIMTVAAQEKQEKGFH